MVEDDHALVRPDTQRVAQLEQRGTGFRVAAGGGLVRSCQIATHHRLQHQIVDQQREPTVDICDSDVDMRSTVELAHVRANADLTLKRRVRTDMAVANGYVERLLVVGSECDGYCRGEVEDRGV